MDNEKLKKIIKVLVIILIVICLAFAGLYGYRKLTGGNNKTELIPIQHDVEKQEEEELLYTLNVYKQKYSYCLEQTEYCKNVAFTIKTKTEDTKVLGFDDNNKFVLFKDGEEVKVYNREKDKSEIIEFGYDYKEYKIYPNEDNNKIIGIVYQTQDNKIGYFNVNNKEKLYEGKYNLQNIYQLTQINDNYLSAMGNDKAYLLNNKTEKEELFYDINDGPSFNYSSYGKNGKYIFALNSCAGDCSLEKLYSNNLKEIYSNGIPDSFIGFKNNILYIYEYESKKIKNINMDGNIKELKTYKDVKGLIEDNIVFVENNKLKYENLENNTITEVCDWNDKYFYDTYASKYYTRYELDNMEEKEKQEGLYIVIDYLGGRDNNGNYGIEYCYKANGEVIEYPIKNEIGGRAKPVLYLYPTKTTNVKVEFAHPEYLTTTYPKYNKSWEVKAEPNGDLHDKDNKYYYGLYWDEVRYNEVDFHEGFYVEKDNAIEFLEEKLEFIGLNNKERNEFIMYWLPILENNEKSLVYFELTKERELGNKLIINPKPDSMLRVSIHIKKVDKKINIKEQELEKFNRFGFSVVEWGGMTY